MTETNPFEQSARWDPAQYERFRRHRERPAYDLFARLPSIAARRVVDLGCGTGALTERLTARFPGAHVVGVDRSEAMLARARERSNLVEWIAADLATWRPDEPVDVIWSNAALHWIEGHDELFARLIGSLRPGGVLAVQMPRNHAAPSHRLVREVLATGGEGATPLGTEELRARIERAPVDEPSAYWERLAQHAVPIDLWETEYQHELEGEHAVFEWLRGTTLRPILTALAGDELARFECELRTRLQQAYPRRDDGRAGGRTRFSFRRLFLVAVKGGEREQ